MSSGEPASTPVDTDRPGDRSGSSRSRPRSNRSRFASVPLWLRLTLVGLVLLASLFAWQAFDEARRTPAEDAPRIEFTVDGLDCPVWCAVRLTESIDTLDGAIVEKLDQKSGRVIVRHDPERQDLATLRQLLDARGFEVKGSCETPAAESKLPTVER